MADSCILAGESDSAEAMHVDNTPTTSDREDDLHSSAPEVTEETAFNSLFVETSREKLNLRAQRFGVEANASVRPISETDVKSLYRSLDVDLKDTTGLSRPNKSRLDTIHMRGVNQMSTQDVFDYFKDHSPVSVEWVNDLSCNIVCLDPLCAARALLSLSQPIRRVPAPAEQKDQEAVAIVSEPEEGEDVEMTENEPSTGEFDGNTSVGHSRRNSGDHVATPVPNNSPIDASQIDDSIPPAPLVPTADIGVEIDSTKVDVPLPPGPWRLGHTTLKAKGVLMRLASRSDRKIPGAEKLSQYYLTHGNPNFKGIKGIISNSLKRKMKEGYKRGPYVDLDAVDDDVPYGPIVPPVHKPVPEYTPRSKEQVPKRPRMRMYADDEEEKQKKSKPVLTTSVISQSASLGPTDLRNRIASDHHHHHHHQQHRSANTDGSDLRSKLASSWSTRHTSATTGAAFHHRDDFDSVIEDSGDDFEDEADEPSSEEEGHGDHRPRSTIHHHHQQQLSRPIVLRDLRSKLEQLREQRQPKVPLLIEVSQEDI